MEHRSSRAIAGLDQDGQRPLTSRSGCFGVGQLITEISAARFVSRERIQFIDQGQEMRGSLGTQGLGLRSPLRRSLERPALPHPRDEPFEQALAQSRVRLLGGQPQEAFTPRGIRGETTVDELGDLRHLRRLHQRQALRGIGPHERLNAIPEQQREVMIRRIFGPAEQRRGHGGALGERKSGQGGSELTADHRRFLLGGQFGEARSDVAGALGHEAYEPCAQVLILGRQADFEQVDLAAHAVALKGREDAGGGQHPERAESTERFGLERTDGRLGGQQGASRSKVGLHAMA